MKKNIVLVVCCIVGVVVFCALRDFVIKNIVTVVATNVSGAPVHIGGFSFSVIGQSVTMTNFKMYSPKGFPRDTLIDIPLIKVSVQIVPAVFGKIHIRELSLDLKEIWMVKNKEGKLNVDSLAFTQKKDTAAKPAPQMAMQMDLVRLHIGKVVSKDYSVSGPPALKVYDIDIQKNYKNITSAQQLTALIIAEPLKAAGIQGVSVYGVSMLTGIAALPVAAAFVFAGKDFAQATYTVGWDKAYAAGLRALKEAGVIKKENIAAGVISADIKGAQVVLKLKKISGNITEITVSARKMLVPQKEIASGVMYRIAEDLK